MLSQNEATIDVYVGYIKTLFMGVLYTFQRRLWLLVSV